MEKVALVLCYYGKQTASAQGSGLLLRRVPPETCNQATGQLWRLWGGGVFPNSKGLHVYFFLIVGFSFTFSLVWEELLKASILI